MSEQVKKQFWWSVLKDFLVNILMNLLHLIRDSIKNLNTKHHFRAKHNKYNFTKKKNVNVILEIIFFHLVKKF